MIDWWLDNWQVMFTLTAIVCFILAVIALTPDD